MVPPSFSCVEAIYAEPSGEGVGPDVEGTIGGKGGGGKVWGMEAGSKKASLWLETEMPQGLPFYHQCKPTVASTYAVTPRKGNSVSSNVFLFRKSPFDSIRLCIFRGKKNNKNKATKE